METVKVRGHTRKKRTLVGVNNRIKHISDWDGTLRTYKAEYVWKKLKPKNAVDLANKLWALRNPNAKTIYDPIYPFFYGCKKLVDFVKRNKPNKKLWNYYITEIDSVDLNADLWKLFPAWRKKYPAKGYSIVFGTKVMEGGWHDAVREFERTMWNKKGCSALYL